MRPYLTILFSTSNDYKPVRKPFSFLDHENLNSDACFYSSNYVFMQALKVKDTYGIV